MEYLNMIIPTTVAAITSIYGLYQRKRAIRAEVSSQEIATADQMIELVKKANADVIAINQEISGTFKKENEKLRKTISKLEKAVNAINACPYRDECPVTDRLQIHKDSEKQGDS